MKTIEQKAKAYDEALERAKTIMDMTSDKSALYTIFPELEESEDENMRKELIEYHKLQANCGGYNAPFHERYVAWLEKQGEQKPDDKVEPKFKIEKGKGYVCIKDLLDNYANKAFRKGDTYLSTQDGSLMPSNSNIPFEVVCPDTYFRDWTIEDAKDGDVLANNGNIILFEKVAMSERPDYKYIKCYCFALRNSSGKVFFEGGAYNLDDNFYPATKEQRDLLFQKMKEAGYEWDAEKKELKIIDWSKHIKYEPNSPSITEESPAWSEEDENLLKLSLENLTELKDRFGKEYGKVGDCIYRLKSPKR